VYSASAGKVGEAYTVASVKSKELVVFSSAKAGHLYTLSAIKAKETATLTFSRSKALAASFYVKLVQVYASSKVQTKRTAAELYAFFVFLSKFVAAQLDRSVTVIGNTASSMASVAAVEGSKLYSTGMVYLKPKTD
jgi:hypothetical protein